MSRRDLVPRFLLAAVLAGMAAAGPAAAQVAAAQPSLDIPEGAAVTDAQYRMTVEPRAYAAPIGSVLVWANPVTGSRGTVTPVSEDETAYGLCRQLAETITHGGQVVQGETTGCRQTDGAWRTVRTTLGGAPYAATVPADLPSRPAQTPPVLLYQPLPPTKPNG